MNLDARARVQSHVRSIQSSAKSDASPAVRPAAAQHFQVPPQSLSGSAPSADNKLEGPKIKDGMDHS